ncbi:MAG: hydantoinase/oxoprolinase family protein [Acidobacteria bacterium]|nr:hydantoinase/oxoprolinase family protein [Acidobacteriota bacterium]
MDTGGTFTDCVFVRDGRLEILKVPSTPGNPALAIRNALAEIKPRAQRAAPLRRNTQTLELTCGTTVGTNALLERRGGRVALVTTAGFEDVIEIGRQARPRLYDLFVTRPAPLVPRAWRIGARERVGADGKALESLTPKEVKSVARRIARLRPDAMAVCFLFSYANPAHERAVARVLRSAGFLVSVSHEILPEFREFERTATTVINAYLSPVMSRYLQEIEGHAKSAARRRARVRIMQSNGGIVSARAASREPVRTILSGPAGGILGAQYVAQLAGFPRIISFDMGGTSTDVALLEGELRTTNESVVAELPVAVPMLDIHTVGAGGGSLARFDSAGALRVGPESAGAEPGPICYGRGEQPTVTDAHVVLGRIPPGGLLGGAFQLDAARARKLMGRARGKMRSVEVFAQGILDVANATMGKAIRVISVERGYDPRDYTLVAFGGAGALHACELAVALQMPRVLVPKFPGALSALGILRADVVRDVSQTVRLAVERAVDAKRELQQRFASMERGGLREMRAEGFFAWQVRIERLLDMRYVGQAYELTVSARGDFVASFHRAHEQRYGYADPGRTVEVVNVRARLRGATPKPELPKSEIRSQKSEKTRAAAAALLEHREVCVGLRRERTAIYDRARLRAGNRFAGPAVVVEYSATTFVPPGWRGRVDAYENMVLEPEGK